MSDDFVEPALEMRDRVRLLVSAILSNTPDRIASLPALSLQSFLECNVDSGVLSDAVSAILKMAVSTRLDPSDVAAWLHGGSGDSLFDRVPRPRGRPPKDVTRNYERAASRAQRLENDIAQQHGSIADAEAQIAHARERIFSYQRQLEEETRFMGVSSFYLMLEALALVNAKAVGMGPLFPVAAALGEAPDRDRMTFVLCELYDSEQFRADAVDALRSVTERYLMQAVLARQAVDARFDPNEPGAFGNGQKPVADKVPDDWFGGDDWNVKSSEAEVSYRDSDDDFAVPAPPSFAARLPSDDDAEGDNPGM